MRMNWLMFAQPAMTPVTEGKHMTQQREGPEFNKAIVERFLDMLNDGELDVAFSQLTEDCAGCDRRQASRLNHRRPQLTLLVRPPAPVTNPGDSGRAVGRIRG